MTVLIKKLRPSEWESAFPIIAQLRNLTQDEFLRSVRVQTLNGYELVAATLEGRIIGVMGIRPVHTLARGSHLHIDDLVVDEKDRHSGTGRLLLDFAVSEAKSREMNFVFLDARKEAIPFYERNDFIFHASPSMKKIL